MSGWALLKLSHLEMKTVSGEVAASAHLVMRSSQERFRSSSILWGTELISMVPCKPSYELTVRATESVSPCRVLPSIAIPPSNPLGLNKELVPLSKVPKTSVKDHKHTCYKNEQLLT